MCLIPKGISCAEPSQYALPSAAVVVKAAQLAQQWVLALHAFKAYKDGSRVFVHNSLWTVHQNLLDCSCLRVVPLATATVAPFTGVVVDYEGHHCISLVGDL